MNDTFLIHVNYENALGEIAKIQNVDKALVEGLTYLAISLREKEYWICPRCEMEWPIIDKVFPPEGASAFKAQRAKSNVAGS